MKTFKLFTLLALLTCLSCNKETLDINSINESPNKLEEDTYSTRGGGSFPYPNNQMIVQYDASITENEKQNMRNSYGVTNYKTCRCADPTLELWIFEVDQNGNILNGGTIEEVVIGAKDDSGLEGTDLNPIFHHAGQKLNYTFGSADTQIGLEHTVTQNTDLTIAVLDTGVDYNYYRFNNPFLYRVSDGCAENNMEDYYGWDFVNGDNDPFDDHGHGTVVSHIVYKDLVQRNIPFQILPVKVFDENGDGHYFDILCGFKYAVNNEDVDMINLSFGWYNNNYSLLEHFVQESENRVLITASAGNLGQNNDAIPHYPSSYQTSNLLAIAAIQNNPFSIELSTFSNYGISSVDIGALGEDIPFYLTPNNYLLLSGTSYANAYATAFGARLFSSGISPQQHFSEIIGATISNPNLSMIKYRSYIHY
ncbi:MAG: S8 family serine peptidase [Flavobacteriaceae bacterium]